jgi:hypothetical protein
MACLARAAEVGRSGDPAAFGTRKRKSSGFAAGALVEQINWLPGQDLNLRPSGYEHNLTNRSAKTSCDSRKLSFGDNSDADGGLIRSESFMNGCVSAWSPRRSNQASTRRSLLE